MNTGPIALNFDVSQVAPQEAFEIIPAGWYVAKIVESELKPTKANDGRYIKATFEIIDPTGKYNNRKVWHNFNIENKNDKAVEIARSQIAAIAAATGQHQVPTFNVLHEKPLQIKLRVKPATDDYDASNEVKAFKPVEGGAVASLGAPAQGVPAFAQQQAPAASAAAPAPAPVPAPAPAVAPAPAPAPSRAAAPGHQMTASAEYTYAEYRASGWEDHQLITSGLMEAIPSAPAPAAPAPVAPAPAPVAAPQGSGVAPAGDVPGWAGPAQ